MASYYFIGGHNYDLKSNYIYEVLLKLTKRKRPKILFFPTASFDSSVTISNFYKQFNNLEYDLETILLTKNKYSITDLYNKAKTSDILFFSGGNTILFYDFLVKSGYDKLLYEFSKLDLIIAGVSAGAMIFNKFGLADAYSYQDNFNFYNYKKVKCLGINDIGLCPHFDLNDRILYFKDYICDCKYALAIDEDCAVYIKDDKIKVFSSINSKNAYIYKKETNYTLELLKKERLFIYGTIRDYSSLAIKKYENMNLNQFFKVYENDFELFLANINKYDNFILEEQQFLMLKKIDLIRKCNYNRICEIDVLQDLCFISKNENISGIKKIYISRNNVKKCSTFLNKLNLELVIKEDDRITYDTFNNSGNTYGAIVPTYLLQKEFKTKIIDIEDSKNKLTYFVVSR